MIIINARFLTQRLTGVQRFAIELSLQLNDLLKDEIQFVCPHDIIHKEYAKQLNAIVIGHHSGYLWEQWDLPRYLKSIGSPLLLSFGNVAPISYKNKVVTLHDITFVRYPQTFAKSFLIFYRLFIPLVLKTSKRIITVSEFSKSEISSFYHIDKDKISVVYNAVADYFKPIYDSKLQGEKYIITVSSVKVNKNYFKTYEAFLLAKKDIPDLKLYVIGDLTATCFKNIGGDIQKIFSDPNVKLLGRISDDEMIRYYSNAKAFVFTSLYEGFGIPVLEAQACGCPVISSNSSSLPEVLQDSALLCNPNNASEFASAITKIVFDQALFETVKKNGFANYARFNWLTEAKKIIALIEN